MRKVLNKIQNLPVKYDLHTPQRHHIAVAVSFGFVFVWLIVTI